jgi:hypothetical protein
MCSAKSAWEQTGGLRYDLGRFGDRMTIRQQNRWRSFHAIACMFAVALLFAPLVAAAWSSYSAACCTSGQCPIHGHHHQHSSSGSENPMDCGHQMPGMAACSMSCCQNMDRPAISPGLFVLPAPLTLAASTIFAPFISLREPQNFLRSIKPLSPPPRFSPAAA